MKCSKCSRDAEKGHKRCSICRLKGNAAQAKYNAEHRASINSWMRQYDATHKQEKKNYYDKIPKEKHVWAQIIQRTTNPNCKDYPDYGGRGIYVCMRWRYSYNNFIADMGPRPGSEYSIDRVDNNGHYEKDNCRWATSEQQANNKRPRFVKDRA